MCEFFVLKRYWDDRRYYYLSIYNEYIWVIIVLFIGGGVVWFLFVGFGDWKGGWGGVILSMFVGWGFCWLGNIEDGGGGGGGFGKLM